MRISDWSSDVCSSDLLSETDRRTLARYFGVDEQLFGGPADTPSPAIAGRNKNRARMVLVPQYDLGASAGAGSLAHTERPAGRMAFDEKWLRDMGANPAGLSMIRVDGDSMTPPFSPDDEIMGDRVDGAARVREGSCVLCM